MANALMQRIGINLGLLGLVGVLAALALFEPGRENPKPLPPLLDVAVEEIQRVTVERTGQETLAFERRADVWQMTAPNAGAANPILIRSILQLAEARCPLQYAAAGLDLKAMGLEPPRLRLRLNDHEVDFGGVTPTDGRRYLQIGATVHLCPDGLYRLLTSAAASFLAPPIESAAANAAKRE